MDPTPPISPHSWLLRKLNGYGVQTIMKRSSHRWIGWTSIVTSRNYTLEDMTFLECSRRTWPLGGLVQALSYHSLHIYICNSGELKLFTSIQIVFQKLFHIKSVGNTKSHFIKSSTQDYLGHDPYNNNIVLLSLLQYFNKRNKRYLYPLVEWGHTSTCLKWSYNPIVAPKSTSPMNHFRDK